MAIDSHINITIHPTAPYIKTSSVGQAINFDFALENISGETLHFRKIQLSVLDTSGKLILQKFLDENGTAPGIETLPKRTIEIGTTQLIFNPFNTLAPEIEFAALQYDFVLESDPSQAIYEQTITVTPSVYQTQTPLIVPLRSLFIVYDGHEFYSHHRRFDYTHPVMHQAGINSNFMRYAYDFCPINDAGGMFSGDEAVNENWIGFDAMIYAPGAGSVIAAHDEMLDNRSFDEASFNSNPILFFGNYLIIDHLNGEYSLLAHLKQGSLKVKIGDLVEQDQEIAALGASGSANIPHLHYELRDGMGMIGVEGRPSYFHDFTRRVGSKAMKVAIGSIDFGDIISR